LGVTSIIIRNMIPFNNESQLTVTHTVNYQSIEQQVKSKRNHSVPLHTEMNSDSAVELKNTQYYMYIDVYMYY